MQQELNVLLTAGQLSTSRAVLEQHAHVLPTLMRSLKRRFDPLEIMNPGRKIVGREPLEGDL
ncbi:MAG: hypothetical protein WD314_06025 [Trueperaceae bacterium]